MKCSRIGGDDMKKDKFVHFIKVRFFLRFHMALILIATGLSGLAASKVLLMFEMDNIVIRYPLAVLLSYGMFFLFIKLWLVYLRSSALDGAGKAVDIAGDILPDAPNVVGNAAARGGELFTGSGGGSGGGGASGLFSASTADASPTEGAGSAALDAVGDIASGGSDNFGLALVVFGAILLAIFGAGIYLVYDAPHILSEAAFQCVLAGSLLRSARKMVAPDWIGGVFRATWVPLAAVLIITWIGAAIIHAHYPGLTKISDIFTHTR